MPPSRSEVGIQFGVTQRQLELSNIDFSTSPNAPAHFSISVGHFTTFVSLKAQISIQEVKKKHDLFVISTPS